MIVDVKSLDYIIEDTEELTFIIDDYTQILPDIYPGPYVVVPKFVNQELATANKLLEHNVLVEEIPVEKVTNLGGGYTVTIGG